MNILEIDAGNTRIKWRLLENTNQQNNTVSSGDELIQGEIEELPEAFCQQMHELKNKKIKKIRASNVRGKSFENTLNIFCEKYFLIKVDFALVSKEQEGLKNSYQNFEELGVDRWLAMLAAYRSVQSAVCIIDCGSAITVDLISAEGQHEGGFIVPGLQMMQRSLGEKTANLNYQPESNNNLEPGTNTTAAINHGVLNMALGMIEKVHNKWDTGEGVGRRWYLCGGDASVLSSFIKWEHEIKPELVMDGLAIACAYQEESV